MKKKKKQNSNSKPKEEGISLEGNVKEALPNAFFKISLENGHEVLARIGGKMDQRSIKVVPGDRVVVEVSPYDLTRGRIIYRNR